MWSHYGFSTNLEGLAVARLSASHTVFRTENGQIKHDLHQVANKETDQCPFGRCFLWSESPSHPYLSLDGVMGYCNLGLNKKGRATQHRGNLYSPLSEKEILLNKIFF